MRFPRMSPYVQELYLPHNIQHVASKNASTVRDTKLLPKNPIAGRASSNTKGKMHIQRATAINISSEANKRKRLTVLLAQIEIKTSEKLVLVARA